MKKLTKAELIKEAAGVFMQYPDATRVIAVTDGNIFLPNAEGHARNHARSTGHSTMEITREEAIAPAKPEKPEEPKTTDPKDLSGSGKETETGQTSGEPEGTQDIGKGSEAGQSSKNGNQPDPAKKPNARTLAKEDKDKEKAAKTGNKKKDTQNHID
jgi:hypothetical protein